MQISRRKPWFLPILAICLFPASLVAQDKSLESLLPADTLAYVAWHGDVGMAGHTATNSLLQLWNDPDLAPARALMAAGVLSEGSKDVPALTKDEVMQLAGNPALAAFIKLPAGIKPHVKPGAPKSAKKSTSVEGALLAIYSRVGREALVDRIVKWSLEEKPGVEIKKTPFHGMQIIERKGSDGSSFLTLAGHYLVLSDYREVLEQWATRLSAPTPPRGALVDTSEFRAARQRVGPAALVTAFLNIRAITDEIRADMKEEQERQAWSAMHFDRLHSVIGSISLGDPATRFEVTLLGDLAPGSVTDLIGASGPDFPTLHMTPAGVFSYSSFRWDLSALYRIARNIFEAFMPPGQGVLFNQVDTMLTQQFGMSMTEMLKLLSGDFTFIKQEPAGELADSVFVLGVQKPADVQHVIELLFSGIITNEETVGDVTMLSVISPIGGSAPVPGRPGQTRPTGRSYCVALAPKMMVIAHRKAEARAFLTHSRTLEEAQSLAGDSKFQAERARLPKDLSALSYADLGRVDWRDVVDKVAAMQKVPIDPKKLDTIKNMFPSAAFSRHIHAFVTGMWKDRSGVYYDGYIE
ncbi:MAG TPA: hypothetical protein VLW54_01380 [Candidatus Acidoferrales bacterium]|nr:hypothetical protein [Candidatus Acidoferrales bacterium]